MEIYGTKTIFKKKKEWIVCEHEIEIVLSHSWNMTLSPFKKKRKNKEKENKK